MAQRRPRLTPLLPIAACMALTACAGGFGGNELARAPGWFKDRQKELAGQDYPDLAAVPTGAQAAGDTQRWAQVEQELKAQGAAIAASPRGAPAPAANDEADAFDKAAREAIGATRPAEAVRPQ